MYIHIYIYIMYAPFVAQVLLLLWSGRWQTTVPAGFARLACALLP